MQGGHGSCAGADVQAVRALQAFHEMLSSKTKLVAMVHVSNMLGCILPAAQVAEAAHKVNLHTQSGPVAAPP